MMKYISTRGLAPELSFEEVALAGLASDGGLYVPEAIPHFIAEEIRDFRGLPYHELAYRVMAPFIGDALPEDALRHMLQESYAGFRHDAVAPLKQLGTNHFLLELFHGPTLAFKDFALQFLGRLMDALLAKRGERATVIGATSGDTGSAAIAGFQGRSNTDIFILYPEGRVSEVQRRQMTSVRDANVHCLAIEGSFDDCQRIVKTLFTTPDFREEQKLIAVNSINWARILAQVVYYFYAGAALGSPERKLSFSVPTGNFGDIYAGYIAKKMGLPIEKLMVATNQNDILTRCINTGAHTADGVTPTLSPSMDIQVSSNFERLLFNLHGQSGEDVRALMEQFKQTQSFVLPDVILKPMREDFASASVSDAETTHIIARMHEVTGELLDPHTAVGIGAVEKCVGNSATPVVTLATAHPAKFPDAVKAASHITPALPAHLSDLYEREERSNAVENSPEAVMAFVRKHARMTS